MADTLTDEDDVLVPALVEALHDAYYTRWVATPSWKDGYPLLTQSDWRTENTYIRMHPSDDRYGIVVNFFTGERVN